jgi:hypothetical protein
MRTVARDAQTLYQHYLSLDARERSDTFQMFQMLLNDLLPEAHVEVRYLSHRGYHGPFHRLKS